MGYTDILKRCSSCTRYIGAKSATGLCLSCRNVKRGQDIDAKRQAVIGSLLDGETIAAAARKNGVTVSFAQKVSTHHLPPKIPARSMANVIRAVCRIGAISRDDLFGEKKQQWLIRIRQAAYLLAFDAGHNLAAVGRAFQRDHSTVRHGIAMARKRIAADEEYAAFLALLRDVSGDVGIVDGAQFIQIERPAFVPAPPCANSKPAAPKSASRLGRNDFTAGEDKDSSHEFHEGIAHGSQAFAAALLAARSSLTEKAA